MKALAILLVGICCSAFAEEPLRIYRCVNNIYTNTLEDPRAKNCVAMEANKPDGRKILMPDEQFAYEMCIRDASKAPTEAGVKLAAGMCNEKFSQNVTAPTRPVGK